MKSNSTNRNIAQLAAGNLQLENGNWQLATGKWLLATGCLQTSAGRKLLNSKPDKRQQSKGFRGNRP
jgi:hypothetical protein